MKWTQTALEVGRDPFREEEIQLRKDSRLHMLVVNISRARLVIHSLRAPSIFQLAS